MNYCFDIDGTICTNTDGKYEEAQVFPEVVAKINALYEAGHRIVLLTARGSTTGIDWKNFTESQLNSWGLKYHQLHMGKPHADIYIDDKGKNFFDWKKELKSESKQDSILKDAVYLNVTYSTERAPYTQYPYRLAELLYKNIYKQNGRLLDVGCGRGEHLSCFSSLGFETFGIDISPEAPKLAKDLKIRVADLEKDPIPYEMNYFDFVFSKSVIEHVRHPTTLMLKTLEMMKPGATAVFMTPSWEYNYKGAFYIDHTHVTPFTAASLADALLMTGYQNIKVSYFYQLPFLWNYPFLKPLIKILGWMPLSYRPFRPAPWPNELNKLIRFSKEIMLMAVAQKPQ